MPSLCSCSVVRDAVENLRIALHARHVFVAGAASDKVLKLKGRLPDDVDVIVGTNLIFTLAGTTNSARITPAVVRQSAVMKHILGYLRANSRPLGLSSVTDMYIDEDDGRAKFSVTSSRPLAVNTQAAAMRLVCVDIMLDCKSGAPNGQTSNEGYSPFSAQVYLPIMSTLERMIERFVCYHLVKRYPLIFGPWRAKLDIEAAFFPSIAQSITNIAERSTNVHFRKKFQKALKSLKKSHALFGHQSLSALNDCLGSTQVVEDTDFTAQTDSDILCHSFERLFRQVIRPAKFKGSDMRPVSIVEDPNDERMFDLSQATFPGEEVTLLGDVILEDESSEPDEFSVTLDETWFGLEFEDDDHLVTLDEDDWPWDQLENYDHDEAQAQAADVAVMEELDDRTTLFFSDTRDEQQYSLSQHSSESDDSVDSLHSNQAYSPGNSHSREPCYSIFDGANEDIMLFDAVDDLSNLVVEIQRKPPYLDLRTTFCDIGETELNFNDTDYLLDEVHDKDFRDSMPVLCPRPTYAVQPAFNIWSPVGECLGTSHEIEFPVSPPPSNWNVYNATSIIPSTFEGYSDVSNTPSGSERVISPVEPSDRTGLSETALQTVSGIVDLSLSHDTDGAGCLCCLCSLARIDGPTHGRNEATCSRNFAGANTAEPGWPYREELEGLERGCWSGEEGDILDAD